MPEDLFVDSGGVRLAVRDYGGSGVPLVLVHGHYGNLGEFELLGPSLARHARVVAYDQRGQGWSERGPMGIAEFSDDLAAVIGSLDLERPALLGSSFGTLVCLGYLLAGGAARAFISQDGRASDFPEPTTRPAPSTPRNVLSPTDWQAYVTGFGALGPEGTAAALRSGIRTTEQRYEVRPRPDDLFRKEEAFVRLRVTDAYRAFDGPVLMLAAERGIGDRVEREQELASLRELIGADVRWFATGHAISAEDLEGVTAAVADLLSRTDVA